MRDGMDIVDLWHEIFSDKDYRPFDFRFRNDNAK